MPGVSKVEMATIGLTVGSLQTQSIGDMKLATSPDSPRPGARL
jgi:hypothetical protein